MKKYKYLLYIIVIIIGAILLKMFFDNIENEENNRVGEFNLLEYEMEIKKFPEERVVQGITDAEIAKQEAEKIWIEIFGNEVKKKKPYEVFYDKQENVWLVNGSLPANKLGGVPYALIRTNGEVIAVWHDA